MNRRLLEQAISREIGTEFRMRNGEVRLVSPGVGLWVLSSQGMNAKQCNQALALIDVTITGECKSLKTTDLDGAVLHQSIIPARRKRVVHAVT